MRLTNRTIAGLAFFAGATQFLVTMIVGEAQRPTYSVSADAISDLGVGSTALLFNTSVFLVGVLSIGGAYFLHRMHRRKLLTILFVLGGVGAMGVGLFPETIPAAHGIFAFTAFVFGGIAAIVAYPLEKEPLNYISVFLGVFGLAAVVLFSSGTYLGLGYGGMERMIVYPVLLWQVAFGGYLLASPTEPLPGTASPPG